MACSRRNHAYPGIRDQSIRSWLGPKLASSVRWCCTRLFGSRRPPTTMFDARRIMIPQ